MNAYLWLVLAGLMACALSLGSERQGILVALVHNENVVGVLLTGGGGL